MAIEKPPPPLCVFCCHSIISPPANDNLATTVVGDVSVRTNDTVTFLERLYKDIDSFRNQDNRNNGYDDKLNKADVIFKNSSSFSVCSTCHKNVGEALQGGKKVEEAESMVRSLQKQVLSALQNLQLVLDEYHQQLGRIERVINSSNEDNIMKIRLKKQEENVQDAVLHLRKGVLYIAGSLRRHQEFLSSKQLTSTCTATEKFADNFTVEEIVFKTEQDEMTCDSIGEHFESDDDYDDAFATKMEKVEVNNPLVESPRRGTRASQRLKLKPSTFTVPESPAIKIPPVKKNTNRKSKPSGRPKTESKISSTKKHARRLKNIRHREKQGKLLTCKLCPNVRVHHVYTFEQHLRTHETTEKPFKCALCPKQFTGEQYFDIHTLGHQGKFVRFCDLCPAKVSPTDHQNHLKSHGSNISIFYCPNCSFVSGSRKTHMVHLLQKHSVKMAGHAQFPCDICSKTHSNFTALQNHVREEHKELVDFIICGYGGLCSKSFTTAAQLKVHQATHSKIEFKCKKCEPPCVFENNRKFLEHMANVHDQGHSCSICCQKFLCKRDLQSHVVREHGAPMFKCDICNGQYLNQVQLNFHKRIHTGNGFECSECGKVFSKKDKLQRHFVIHTTERHFTCEQCGLNFKTPQTLKKHLWTHGVDTPAAVKCKICDKSFTRPDNLKTHLRIHENERPYVCDLCGKSFTQSSVLSTHKKKLHPASAAPPTIDSKVSSYQINN